MTEGAARPSERTPEQHLGLLSDSVHSSPAFQSATWAGAGRTVGSLGNDLDWIPGGQAVPAAEWDGAAGITGLSGI